jgi:transcription-repair coupling factor (superfamily II helicase)
MATTALCTGVVDGQKCLLASALCGQTLRPMMIVTHSEAAAREISRDMAFFSEAAPMYFPAREYLADYVDVAAGDVSQRRLAVLQALIDGAQLPLVCSAEALFASIAPKVEFSEFILRLAVGDEVNLDDLALHLVRAGYNRADMAEGPGQFAIRGGIVDIFSMCPVKDPVKDPLNHENHENHESCVRIELWGDEIDSIRAIDPVSQRSVGNLENAVIYPACERFGGERATLMDYLPENTVVFFDEPARIAQSAAAIHEEYRHFFEGLLEREQAAPEQFGNFLDYATVLRATENFERVLFSLMSHSLRDFKPTAVAHFDAKSSAVFSGRLDLLVEDLDYLVSQNYTTVILAGGATRARRLCEELTDMRFSAHYLDNLDDLTDMAGRVALHSGNLSKGFEMPIIKLAVISGAELFGGDLEHVSGKKSRRRAARRKKGAAIDSFTDLNVGDYVVHDNHGVGIYRGLEKIEIDGVFRDYLKISYHGESALYVAINQMDALQKYIGAEGGGAPRINRLGGADWQKTKAKAKAAVEEVAKELVELYAKREATRGHSYGEDTVWQAEFEDTFIYEETDDQLAAVEDVKHDMEAVKVMDRLICGDVGYGKTEVAIRAAFKAVCDQKQVALLCPTTILAQQHYNTFVQRMKDYPINIDVISRFRAAKEQRATLDRVKAGAVDILIGTHRLLSSDVEFKNLGLIVVDEEQRFGVLHKEKLKQNWANVDVMTLTATPIPRTLHMSLAGIRDMSLLEEPPHERRPIQTYVLEFSEEIIKSAIMREISRGGQIYYLHNRVRNIAATADKIQKLVPQAQIAYAHGQMSETHLENVMMDFVDGAIDVLVCTTIIESGLDIPNVNTIIIQDADNMGLAQLYQLRGRVGRAGRSSFAYLMYRKDKVLTEKAEARLQTIREFTEFGAGFKIAMRDLEIRGAGNILGAAQHGHMDAVGYEMYCKLLDMAVKAMRGEEAAPDFETHMDIVIDAFIPESYIGNEQRKLEIYKKISHIANEQDFLDVQEELLDRFGPLPPSAQNLLDIALLKARARNVDIISIAQKSRVVIATFKGDARVDPMKISEVVEKSNGRLKFKLGTTPHLALRFDEHEDFMPTLSSIILQLNDNP